MMSSLKLRKSAGVPVSLPVHRILRQANAARDAHDYTGAAAGYGAALEADPGLAHIWLQYGHMLRKIGQFAIAEDAYRRAFAKRPAAEPHLHLGHLYKESGNMTAAGRSYLEAARHDPNHGDALAELHTLVARGGGAITLEDIADVVGGSATAPLDDDAGTAQLAQRTRASLDLLLDALRRDGNDAQRALADELTHSSRALAAIEATADAERPGAAMTTPIVFDVSDLISYFQNARLPTGIQRVQIETVCNALHAASGGAVSICAFQEHRDAWVGIPVAMFRHLAALSMESGDRQATEWTQALTRLRLLMMTADAFAFPDGAFLVNLGTSWWLQNYFLYVRQAKAEHNIRYVPFVHDLIPVMAPEHCITELTQDFISWAVGAFDHADFYLVNSEATKRDLLKVATLLGHQVCEDDVEVVHLDADFRKIRTAPVDANALDRWGIGNAPFVLFVSTIESRKNHLGAFEAWINLIRDHGLRRVPKLVCVGNKGWLNDAVHARLASHEQLRNRVVMLSGLSDNELDLLYRTCLFTLYPSNYEGWGLPVTESLCYGKVPLIADSSSLPEAGGEFADYFEAGSVPRLTAALDRLIFDPSHRRQKQDRIARDFRPRQWRDVATQMADAIERWSSGLCSDEPSNGMPLAGMGAYHPIVRTLATRLLPGMRSAEVFRAGSGWWGPDNWGCWTKPQGGQLHIAIPAATNGAIRFYFQLHGLPAAACPWSIDVEAAGEGLTGEMPPQAFKWVAMDIAAVPADRIVRVTIQGETTADLRTVTDGGDGRIVSIGVAGFFLCEADDAQARMAFLEAVALDNFNDLAFDRLPADDRRATD